MISLRSIWRFGSLLGFICVLFLAGCSRSNLPTETPTRSLSGRLTFAGSTTVQPLADKLGKEFQRVNPDLMLEIAAGGTSVGIQAVHDGTADIGMASRELSPEEKEGIEIFLIAQDVLAMIVHPQNTVTNITEQNLADIYSGKITNWKEIGGEDLPIIVVIRDQNSGSRGAFDELVLEKEDPSALDMRTAITAGDVVATVTGEPGAIGYVGFGNLDPSVKVLELDSVMPTLETVQKDQYPLKRPLQLLTGPLTQPMAKKFIEFTLSNEGQTLIKEDGWVPLLLTDN